MALPQSVTIGQPAPRAPAATPAIQIAGVSVGYESGLALDSLSCTFYAGEQVAVVGPNGAGKSTLFKLIAGLLKPDAGSIQIAGGGAVAYLPQRSQVDWRFPASVADVVMMGRFGQIGLLRRPGRRDRELVREALATVRLEHLAQRQIGQLSGGQQQRVFLARALAQEARILLMDEPLNGLDRTAQDDIFHILEELRPRGVTVLTALHDLQLAARHFDRVLLLNRRLIGIGPAGAVFTPDRLVAAYGGHLHLAVTRDGILTVTDTCCDHG